MSVASHGTSYSVSSSRMTSLFLRLGSCLLLCALSTKKVFVVKFVKSNAKLAHLTNDSVCVRAYQIWLVYDTYLHN